MNTITMSGYRPLQKLHPLSLLAQMTSRRANGCLQVSSGSTTWSIYLEHGKLVYASNSNDPFERLDRHLRRLSLQLPSLASAIRVQVRLVFEKPADHTLVQCPDYQAICWLVDQQHLPQASAATLIEDLAKEVLESFLTVQDGTQEFDDTDILGGLPLFCQLDLRPLVEHCQAQLRRRQFTGRSPNSPTSSQDAGKTPYAARPSGGSSPAPSLSTPEPHSALKPPLSGRKSTYTIACIDDSPTVLQAINTFLDDHAFTVIMISNPVSALMQIIRTKPDLILLDVTMPNLDGYELCSLLRRHPSFKNTPIVMVTGNTGFIDRARAKLVGASGYLTKPFTQPELIKTVFKHLS